MPIAYSPKDASFSLIHTNVRKIPIGLNILQADSDFCNTMQGPACFYLRGAEIPIWRVRLSAKQCLQALLASSLFWQGRSSQVFALFSWLRRRQGWCSLHPQPKQAKAVPENRKPPGYLNVPRRFFRDKYWRRGKTPKGPCNYPQMLAPIALCDTAYYVVLHIYSKENYRWLPCPCVYPPNWRPN